MELRLPVEGEAAAGHARFDAANALMLEAFGPQGDLATGLAPAQSRAWIILDSNAVLGVVLGWQVLDEFDLHYIVCARTHRRQGLASTLLIRVANALRSMGVQVVRLEVSVNNAAAIALYRRHGFEEGRKRPRYYPDGSDAVELSWLLRAAASD